MKLEPADLLEWKHRFNGFNDAVVKRWQMTPHDGALIVEVDVETKDLASKVSGWSLVKLKISGCESLHFFRSEKLQYEVLSNGLHVLCETGVFGLEFGDYADTPDDMNELRRSRCHVTGREIFWDAVEVT